MSLFSLISGGLNCCFPILPSLYSSLNFWFSSLFLPLLNFYLHLISSLSFTLHHILHFTLVLYLHIYPYPALLILNPCPPIFQFILSSFVLLLILLLFFFMAFIHSFDTCHPLFLSPPPFSPGLMTLGWSRRRRASQSGH